MAGFTFNRTRVIDAVGGFFDDLLEPISPSLANRRRSARGVRQIQQARHELVMRAYETGRDKLREKSWIRSELSPDSALEEDLADLRRSSNELYRTMGFATGAIEGRVNNVVGVGIRPQSRIAANAAAGVTAERAKQLNTEIEALFEQLSPIVGTGGRQSLWQMQRLVERCWLRDGEAFVIFSDVGRTDKPIPLQMDVIDAERVETPNNGGRVRMPDGTEIKYVYDPVHHRLGINKSDSGEILGYWVRDVHPGDTKQVDLNFTYYPAERVCHIYEQLWPDQSRGLPWFFSIISLTKDFKDFREAVLVTAQVAACTASIISTSNPELFRKNSINADGLLEMKPGQHVIIGETDSVTPFNPAQPMTSMEMFDHETLVQISAALCEPYGWMTGNRKGQSFSAGRLEEVAGQIPVDVQQKTLSDCWLRKFWIHMLREAVIVGAVAITAREFSRFAHVFLRHVWLGPGRPFLDGKELKALLEAVDKNAITLGAIHARMGEDSETVFRTRGQENAWQLQYGCVPPDQNSKYVEGSGSNRNDGTDTDDEPTNADDEELAAV